MKKTLFLTAILCVIILTGCGHKSDKDTTDIEQFRCQDSIETVFSVLGEAGLKNDTFAGDYCEYEDLNLWGYNGSAVFKIRDDGKTIQSFYSVFKLNNKEFKDILSQLEEKYGKYEKHEYSNQIVYIWKIEEDETKEIGYNEIKFIDYGDDKYVVEFYDECSRYNDEAYYKHLEEENQANVLAEHEYNIDDDRFVFVFSEKDGEHSLNLICYINDKSDAFWTHISLNALFNNQEDMKWLIDDLNFSYSIMIGDGVVLIRKKDSLTLMSVDDGFISVGDYFSTEWMTESAGTSDYGELVGGFLVDFIQNY